MRLSACVCELVTGEEWWNGNNGVKRHAVAGDENRDVDAGDVWMPANEDERDGGGRFEDFDREAIGWGILSRLLTVL